MNSAILRYLILGCVVLAVQLLAEAGSLRKVWELQLDPIIKEPTAADSAIHTVNAIRFSPDEQQLAVVVDMHSTEGSFASHLLILDAKSSGTAPHQIELKQGVFPGDAYPSLPPLFWSPDGQSIAMFDLIISLQDGKTCLFEGRGLSVDGYIKEQTLLGRITPVKIDFKHPHSRFALFNSHCELVDSWAVDDAWLTDDISSESGLALVQQGAYDRPPSEHLRATLLVDFRSKRVLRQWSTNELLPKQVRFADGGKVVCAAAGGVGRNVVPVRCVDVDTGKVIAEATGVKRAWSITTASESSRVVIAQYRREPENKPTTLVVERRIVWDFRTGRQIVAWRPEFQKWRFPIGEIKHWRSNPFVFAISPTGRYIAEGGNGVLRLYEIEP
jgi:hypothetical protein